LGTIVEKISGKKYQESVKERITDRIGMNNTFGIEKNSPNSVVGKWDLNSLSGSGSIVTTPGDLGKFMSSLFCGDLLTIPSLHVLLGFDDGLNQIIAGNTQGYGYSGSMEGFYSQMIYFPSDSVCISFSMNKNNSNLDELVRIIYGS
jgi:D-alanyl-D-alanine carboxypeptidase